MIIKHGATEKQIKELEKKLSKRKPKQGVDTHKYCGTVKFGIDGLKLQKQLRSEWN